MLKTQKLSTYDDLEYLAHLISYAEVKITNATRTITIKENPFNPKDKISYDVPLNDLAKKICDLPQLFPDIRKNTIQLMTYFCMKTTELFVAADKEMQNQDLITKIIDFAKEALYQLNILFSKIFNYKVEKRHRDQIKDYENPESPIGKFILISWTQDNVKFIRRHKLPTVQDISRIKNNSALKIVIRNNYKYIKLDKDIIYKNKQKDLQTVQNLVDGVVNVGNGIEKVINGVKNIFNEIKKTFKKK
jgi:hypothetical protein